MTIFINIAILALSLVGAVSTPAQRPVPPIPDFTKGGTIPTDAPHDWNLGATGLRGWMATHEMETSKARQIPVTQVAPKSPADGIIESGDVILGVAGQRFSYDPRTEFGKALTAAETEEGAGKIAITRWRDGETSEVTINLPILGEYSPIAPFECPKSKKILDAACEALAEKSITQITLKMPFPAHSMASACSPAATGNSSHF